MTLAPITDYDDRAVERLLSQFQGKVRIEALVKACAAAVQEVEDLLIRLIDETTFENATGVHLDAWGALVGEQRLGLSDADYRTFIAARVLANRCLGTTDEMIRIFDLIDGVGTVREWRLLWAGFELYSYRPPGDLLSDALKRRIVRMMQSIKPLGVSMELFQVPHGYFGWSEDPDALGFDVGLFTEVL